MREIKFRNWDSINKVMMKPHTYADAMHFDWAAHDYLKYDTMQWTGLLDKAGKEIYEGDILKDGWSLKGEDAFGTVTFEEGYISYGIGYTESEVSQAEDSEVIGNIYENPELLK